VPARKGKKGTHIGFKRLSRSLQRKGHSKGSADAIAASIGRKKYGAKGMARKSAAARRKRK
jgi:hypothetical protein